MKHTTILLVGLVASVFVMVSQLSAQDQPLSQITLPRADVPSSLGTAGRPSVAEDIGLSGKDFSNVSLYTGDLAFPVSLASLGNVDVKLQYNSGVHKRVRSDNTLAPSGWVGLGWSLNLGSIRAEISNTADTWDDHYYYSDGDGSSEIVQLSTGEFVLQDGRPWKITIDTTFGSQQTQGYIRGWIITRDDGSVYRYGNYDRSQGAFVLCPDGPTFATRCYLGIDNHRLVMNPPYDSDYESSQYIAYGWDLSDVQNLSGGHTTIMYQQDTVALALLDGTHFPRLSSYTRQSHPWKIQDDEGGEIEFVLGSISVLGAGLYDDNYPPFTQNLFEQRYLQKLLLKRNGTIFKQVVLSYTVQNVLGHSLSKYYLTSIQEQDASNNVLPSTKFSYSSGTNAVNPGALEQITYPAGGSVRYKYKAQQLTQELLNDSLAIDDPEPGDLSHLGETGVSGKDFFVLMERTAWNTRNCPIFSMQPVAPLRVYRWGPVGWFADTLFRQVCGKFAGTNTYRSDCGVTCMVGHDFVFLVSSPDSATTCQNTLLRRTLRGWTSLDVNQVLTQAGATFGDEKAVFPIGQGPNYIVVLYDIAWTTVYAYNNGTGQYYPVGVNYNGHLAVIRLLPECVTVDLPDPTNTYYSSLMGQGNHLMPYNVRAHCGSNYFVVVSTQPSAYPPLENHFRWQNSHWVHIITNGQINPEQNWICFPEAGFSVGNNFITRCFPNGSTFVRIYQQTSGGVRDLYDTTIYYGPPPSPFAFDRGVGTVGTNDRSQNTSFLQIWNGKRFDPAIYGDGQYDFLSAAQVGNHLINVVGQLGIQGIWSSLFASNGSRSYSCLVPSVPNVGGAGTVQLSSSGSGYSSFYAGWVCPWNDDAQLRFFTPMGDTVYGVLIDTLLISPEQSSRFWQAGDNFVASAYVTEQGEPNSFTYPLPIDRVMMYATGSDAHGFPCFRGHPYDYVVATKTVYSGMGDSTVTRYEFDSTRAVYDETMTTAKYNKATVYYPGSNGRTVSYFYNDLDGTQAEAFIPVSYFDELDGTCYRTRDYDQSGALVREVAHLYTVDAIDTVLSVFHQELLADTTTTDGLASRNSYVYNDRAHGYTLSSVTETNSNGVKRISHMQYPLDYNISGSSPNTMVAALDSLQHGKHAPSTLIEKWIVQDSAGVQKVLKGDLTTFRCVSSAQVLPDQVLSLRSNTPVTNFVPSSIVGDPGVFAPDTRYSIIESFDSYTSNGKPVQVRDANGVPRTTKWGYSLAVSSATIAGASDSETSVVDFEDGTWGDWDDWSMGSVSSTAHTGVNGWYVDGTAYQLLTRVSAGSSLTTGGKYTVSAWVKTSSTKPNLLWYVHYNNGTSEAWPASAYAHGTGQWELLESTLDLSAYANITQIAVYARDGENGGPTWGSAYWDDLRFAPSNSIVQTTAYDPVTLLPTSTSDASNMPQYTTYDSFGRVVQVKDDQGRLLKDLTYYYSRAGNGDAFSQSDPNWTRTRIYRGTSDTTSARSYTDGLGRTIQTETFLSNANGYNLIAHVTYDSLGRVQRAYKPYTASLGSSHTYDASFSSNASSYYTNQGVALGGFPYSETQYQANPLNRMQKQSAPGATYALGSGKEVKMDYWSESANKYFVTRKKDEQDQSQRTSADLFGNTMQTVTDSAGLNLTTSFTYNTLGQLLSSTPPLGANYKSTYSYTTRGEMTSKTTPDAGTVQYLYDKAGRVRLVKDANHTGSTVGFNTVSGTIPMNRLVTGNVTLDMPGSVTISTGTAYQGPPTDNITLRLKKNGALIAQVQTNGMLQISLPRGTFAYEAQTPAGGNSLFTYNLSCSNCLELIYMKYDGVGRLLEEGEFMGTSATADFTQANADNTSWPSTGRIWLKTLTYDLPSTDPVASGQRNVHGQVSTAASYGITTFYSYNSRGQVEWVVRKDPAIASTKLYYDYDLAGNLTRKRYVDLVTPANNHYFFYEYDEANRLARMYSGTDSTGVGKVKEAAYKYLATGQLKADTLGATPAQVVSYAYTERDWVREINAPKFMERMHYCNTSSPGLFYTAQYNGNIAAIIWRTNTTDSLCYNFLYDKANRLTTAASFSWSNPAWGPRKNYGMPCMNYDGNGNITRLSRYGSGTALMDTLNYHYLANANRLDYITDGVAAGAFSSDIDNQSAGNYTYDGNGNVSAALGDSLGFVIFDINNQPSAAYKLNGTSVQFKYDANGMRVQKIQGAATTSYILGAGGITEVVVTGPTTLTYNFFAGAENLGQARRSGSTLTRYYYLKDHLGSMRATVTTSGSVDSYFDFYPYGQPMDGRTGVASADPRYKYIGKELDQETGYDYFGARYYDCRIGRWLAVDLMAELFPSSSPFVYAQNNPVGFVDACGLADSNAIWRTDLPIRIEFPRFISPDDPPPGRLPPLGLPPPSIARADATTPSSAPPVATTPANSNWARSTAEVAEKVSTGTSIVGYGLIGGGLLTAPEGGLAAVEYGIYILKIGTVSNVVSTIARGIDLGLYDGTAADFGADLLSLALSSGGTKLARSAVTARWIVPSQVFRTPFKNGLTGRFIPNTVGIGASCFPDVTGTFMEYQTNRVLKLDEERR